jgi:predicted nucleic acid-binding protein
LYSLAPLLPSPKSRKSPFYVLLPPLLTPLSIRAEQLLLKWQGEGTALIAPALLLFEVTSVLRRFVYLNTLTPDEGEDALNQFLRIPIRLSSRRGIFQLAFHLARDLNRPRAYDTAYLALAQLSGCGFWTADERLYNAAKGKLAWVNWVGSLPGP